MLFDHNSLQLMLAISVEAQKACYVLKGLAQAKFIEKSVILFWLPNMTI